MFPTISPYLVIDNGKGSEALKFYKSVFGAKIKQAYVYEGKIGHSEFDLKESKVMLADHCPPRSPGPLALGGSPIMLNLMVDDVDAAVEKVVKGGGKITKEVTDQIYGWRTGEVEDPFGYRWHLCKEVKQMSEKELEEKMSMKNIAGEF